ncbi:MAG TPA: type II toxin-antitoxin system HipA family toxin YjjJ [Tahibacter sp.]|nr:type II toxin-antitoxin system HipA family toxin YjjJ [Tahibacter sp.]
MATQTTIAARLLDELRRRGRQPAAALQQALAISRPTLARAVAAEPRVVRLGKARATQYALARDIRGDSRWPLYRIGADARIDHLGTLISLERGEFALLSDTIRPALQQAPFGPGVYPDLPWFLDDLRPSGFLGLTYAHRIAASLGVPSDITVWNAEHVLAALLQGDSTQAGDLVVGERALARTLHAMDKPPDLVAAAERVRRYPVWADDVLRGEPPGSSPGGEQAKFTATVDSADGRYSAIVKFSAGDDNPAARRWAALLRCEALVGTVLSHRGIAAADARIVESGKQVFLESRRFDRTTAQGRRGYVSLASVDAAFYGHASIPWWRFADELERDGWLSAEDATALRRTYWFGALIANTDMHLGNFGLVLADALPLRAAPVFDMLPMLLRPSSQGIVTSRNYAAPPPAAGQAAHWHWAAEAAIEFWNAALSDPATAAEIGDFAAQAVQEIRRMAARF